MSHRMKIFVQKKHFELNFSRKNILDDNNKKWRSFDRLRYI